MFLSSPTPEDTQVEEEDNAVVPIQPFCLEEEEPPASMPSNTQQTDQSEHTDPGAPVPDESAASGNLIEMEPTEESETQEVGGVTDKTPVTCRWLFKTLSYLMMSCGVGVSSVTEYS